MSVFIESNDEMVTLLERFYQNMPELIRMIDLNDLKVSFYRGV